MRETNGVETSAFTHLKTHIVDDTPLFYSDFGKGCHFPVRASTFYKTIGQRRRALILLDDRKSPPLSTGEKVGDFIRCREYDVRNRRHSIHS